MITLFKEIKSTRDKKFKKVYLAYSFRNAILDFESKKL